MAYLLSLVEEQRRQYLIYLPKDLEEDTMFPFKDADSINIKVSFEFGGIYYLQKSGKKPKTIPLKL